MNLLHLFIPHHKNNHRSRLLHNVSLLVLIVFFTAVSSITIAIHKTYPEVLGISYQISDTELLNLVNYERGKNNLPALTLNKELTQAAKAKANNMFALNYWAHFAPDGTSPWDFIRNAGYDYVYAGENLAKGYTTSYDAVNAWMNSPTHRANILSPQFKDVGFAIKEGTLQGEDTILIVQEFGAKANEATTNTKALVPVGTVQDTSNGQKVMGSSQEQIPAGPSSISKSEISSNPLFDLVFGTRAVTFIMLSILLIALILDFIIVEKKKIPRSVGNNLDHILLVTLFIVFIFIAKLGNII